MDFLSIIIVAILALAFLIPAWWLWIPLKNKLKKLPPGPTGFPIYGSLHLLGKLPHRDLQKLSQKYGSIMSMQLGFVRTIVVSSPEAAEAFLKTHGLNFSCRPSSEAGKHMFYEQQNLTFARYGPYWRDMRKMCTLELLGSSKVASFRPVRTEEVGLLAESIKEASKQRVVVDVSSRVAAAAANISCRMVFGKKYSDEDLDERGFKDVIRELMHLAGVPNIGDYIPHIAGLDLQGLTKRMKVIFKILDGFFEKIIDEHIQNKNDDRVKDFVDIMLDFVGSEESAYSVSRESIKGIMLDMLAASMDTAATTVEWVLSELIIHPRTMNKLKKELQEKIGMKRMVEESDLEGLEYLDSVIKETLRLHPVAPLLVPHRAMEDCNVNGYFIPKDSRVIINIWSIGRDNRVWENADKFSPERFQGKDIDIGGRDFRILPLGSGRRSCPGMVLGMTLMKLMVAQLVHCFDWELPNGMLASELDMSEVFGTVTPRARPLLAIPTYRLHA